MPGFLKGPKLAAIVRTLRLRKLYISRFTSVIMPFDLYSQKGRHEERALVDSGAMANFIDYKTVKRLGLGSKKLDQMRTVKNIDGTLNVAGNITHACNLLVSHGRKQERTRFFVTNLGGDRFIFGYPWLATFNPDINWPEAIVNGPRFRVEMLVSGKLTQKEYLQHMQTIAIAQLEEGDELIMSLEVLGQEPMHIRKTTLAQQMAEKAYNATKVNTEETVPAVFKQHWRVFSEKEARQLPPHQEYDHQIELQPDAPNVINSKVYPLSQNEQKVLDEYLTDNLEKGISWHHLHVMVLPCLQSRKRMAHSESYMTTASSTNTPSSTLPRCRKYPRSSKNFKESHSLASLIFEQGTTISAYWRRTRT